MQTGIIAWGVDCGINGVPGVYANVTDGLCFIDYATKCVLGDDVDLYGLHGCKRWAKRQYCELKFELETIEELVSINVTYQTLILMVIGHSCSIFHCITCFIDLWK